MSDDRPSTPTRPALLERFGVSPTAVGVIAITLAALLVRLIGLGSRIAHQDEARVAYWAVQYLETGYWTYRPIVHGPFLTQVDAGVFGLLGANDFTMRLIVALLSGLFPLIALLFRERLRSSEQLAFALLLAANPAILYYSRFMRNDVLLAGFMLAALGFFVRAIDTKIPGYLFAGTALFALAFTTKENALVYPVTWAGAALLLFDHRLFVERGDGWTAAAKQQLTATIRGLWTWRLVLLVAVVEFFAIIVFFYAPRTPGTAEIGIATALDDPTRFPMVIREATVGSWDSFVDQWGAGNENSYLGYLKSFAVVLKVGAPALLGLSVVGFLTDRYASERPRDVPAFCFYWGVASLLGYPVIVDNAFPWEIIHGVIPLTVPAAVGLAVIYRWGTHAARTDDLAGVTMAAVVLVAVAGTIGGTAYATSFANPQSPDNELVQYAQPSTDLDPALAAIERATANHEGTDVLFYGNEFYSPNESEHETPPAGTGWFGRLPLAWYLNILDVEVASTNDAADVQDGAPPVVIALGDADTCHEEYQWSVEIDEHLTDYERYEGHRFAYNSGCTVSRIVVFVKE